LPKVFKVLNINNLQRQMNIINDMQIKIKYRQFPLNIGRKIVALLCRFLKKYYINLTDKSDTFTFYIFVMTLSFDYFIILKHLSRQRSIRKRKVSIN